MPFTLRNKLNGDVFPEVFDTRREVEDVLVESFVLLGIPESDKRRTVFEVVEVAE